MYFAVIYDCLLNSYNEKAAENEIAKKNNIGRKLLIQFHTNKFEAEENISSMCLKAHLMLLQSNYIKLIL